MVPTRIKSLLLGILMGFVAISGSIADARQVGNRRENIARGNRFAAATTGVEVVGQVHAEQAIEVSNEGKRWLKGRKMVVENVSMKDDAMKGESVSGGRTSEMNSGKDKDASQKLFGTSQIGMNYQNVDKEMKPMAVHFANVHTTRTTRNSNPSHVVSSEISSAVKSSISQESHPPAEAIEAEKLLKDALETMHMLTMDYRQKPRRKPPINNGHPLGGKSANP